MYIAIEKRRENIAEYILYLWQLEDLLRALQFSPEAIYSQLVKPRGLKPEEEEQLLAWYNGIVDLMRKEGKEETGHLEHTFHLIADLHNLHLQLLSLPVGERYAGLYRGLEPELSRLRAIASSSEKIDEAITDTEIAFRALYAAMLYRMKGEEKASRIADEVVEVVSPAIAELAHMYKKVENGEVDLFEEVPND